MEKDILRKNCLQWVGTVSWLAVFLLLLFPMSALLAAESLEEGAKREGKVLFYSISMDSVNLPLLNAFQKKYPFIKAESYRGSAADLLKKIYAAKQMGKTFADVVSATGAWIGLLKKDGLLAQYIAPEANFVPREARDPDGFWTANYTTYFTFTYNTKMVDKKNLPKSYEDLLNPRWKEKIGLGFNEVEWFIGMMDYLGEEKGMQFMKRLAEQKPSLRSSRNLAALLQLAGEFPLALGVVQTTRQRQAVGAPLDMIPFPTPTLAAMRMIGVSANAPHPNAAKLLVNFLLSKDGQTIYQQDSYDPIRSGIKVDPVVEKIMHNMFFIKPRDPEVVEGYKKEMDKIFQRTVIK